jgi:hypothetical protein
MRKPQNEKTRAGQAGQKTIRQLAAELGISKSAVARRLAKEREEIAALESLLAEIETYVAAPESNKPPLSVRLKAVLALVKETGKQ